MSSWDRALDAPEGLEEIMTGFVGRKNVKTKK